MIFLQIPRQNTVVYMSLDGKFSILDFFSSLSSFTPIMVNDPGLTGSLSSKSVPIKSKKVKLETLEGVSVSPLVVR